MFGDIEILFSNEGGLKSVNIFCFRSAGKSFYQMKSDVSGRQPQQEL